MNNNNKILKNKGAAMMIVVLFFVSISLSILIGIINPAIREFRFVKDNLKSKQTYFLAESGVEDVLYRMKNNKQTNSTETITLGDSSSVTTVTDISSSQKELTSLGDTDSLQRKVKITVDTGIGASFSYGVLSGSGGFNMNNGSKIIGSVYSNGSITGSGTITGSATSANSSSLNPDQTNGSGVPSHDVVFGKTDAVQDFAQSFQINNTEVVNKVDLYLKKVGSPSNLTVRITTDAGGKPSTTTVASGTLSASLVSSSYGFVSVPFSTNPLLVSGTTYWIVIDSITSSTKYYYIGANNDGYSVGSSKIGQYSGAWNNNSPTTLDGFFSLYTGGVTGIIDGVTIGDSVSGNAYAHTIKNSTISGTAYCKEGAGNNKTCNTSRTDPVQVAMPISEQNVLDFKDQAAIGGTYNGSYTVSGNTTLGPKKITGNLTITNGDKLTLGGTIWVQGNLLMDNNSIMNLVSGYGSSEGVIVVDGTITISNNATFAGSGTPGSYVLALSTSTSSSAISLSNNGGAVALYAAHGTINVSNNGTAKALTGHYIHLGNNAVITYDSGLANANFSSGPSGTWNVKSWKEVE